MAKYVKCIQTSGSLVIFDGLVAMEYLDELRLSDDAFLRTDVQDAITNEFLIEISAPGVGTVSQVTMIGDWDANVESNYPPAIFGHSYLITDAGQLTNGVQTENYSIGDRIVLNLHGYWELWANSGAIAPYTGEIWVSSATPTTPTDTLEIVTTPQGFVTSVTTSGTQVTLTIHATPNSLGATPIVTVDGVGAIMLPDVTGFKAVVTVDVVDSPIDLVHENGATASVTLASSAPGGIVSATIVDTFGVLSPVLRTEYAPGEQVSIEFSVTTDVDFVQVRNSGSFTGGSAIAVGAGTGPHTVLATVAAGVGVTGGEIRVGTMLGGTLTWEAWTPTSNTIPRSDVTPSMTKGTVTVSLINPVSGLPYTHLDYLGTATITGNIFYNTNSVVVTPGSSGNIGSIPISTSPATFSSPFTVQGVQNGVGSSDDKLGINAITYTLTKASNGITAIVADQLIPYYAKDFNMSILDNEESLISGVAPAGTGNWIAIDNDDAVGDDVEENQEILLNTITLDASPSAGTWETTAWRFNDPAAPSWVGNRAARKLVITDAVRKGEHPWVDLNAKTISGREANWTGPGTYLVAGFSARPLPYIAPTATWKHGIDHPWHADNGAYLAFAPGLLGGTPGGTPFVYNPTNLICTNGSFPGGVGNYIYSATDDPDTNGKPGDEYSTPFVGQYTMLVDMHAYPSVPGEEGEPNINTGAKIEGASVTGGVLPQPVLFHGGIWFNINQENAQSRGSTSSVTLEETRSPFIR